MGISLQNNSSSTPLAPQDWATSTPRLCPKSEHDSQKPDCCSPELEQALLRKTTEELRQVLSSYLGRWSRETGRLQNELRADFFQSLELFRGQLNATLCVNATTDECKQLATEIVPRFQITIEQLLVGPTDGLLDISTPIDNLILQLLIDTSCSPTMSASPVTRSMESELKEFDRELKCHKYCQSRVNLILEILMNAAGPNVEDRMERTRSKNALAELDQYKLWFTSELLFSIRLNRLLLQALELAESLLEGLREFNPSQGICALKLMRMHRCALCAGEVLTRPCPQLCFSILSNCFKPLSELQATWSSFTKSVRSVVNTIVAKPHLRVTYQMRRAPTRMIKYFHSLLYDNFNWLEPHCPGTRKLLDVMRYSLSNENSSVAESGETNVTYSQENLLRHIEFKMDQMAEIWLRVSSSLCTESPQLVPTTTDLDQCWNGTSRSRFHYDRCDFCDNKMNSAFQESSSTSQFPSLTHSEVFASQPPGSTGNEWNSQIIPTDNQVELNMATERANNILVRAPGDLQWTSDMLSNELRAYHSILPKIERPTADHLTRPDNVRQPLSSNEKETNPTKINPEAMDDSLRSLVYTSMLGWNVGELGRKRQVNDTQEQILFEQTPDHTNNITTYTMNGTQPFAQPVPEGSGLSPDWLNYQWHQPSMLYQGQPISQPAQTNVNQYDDQGSGFAPVTPEYADYPSVNTFHNFINTANLGNPMTTLYGGYSDDEDFQQSITTDNINILHDLEKPKVSFKANEGGNSNAAQHKEYGSNLFVFSSVAIRLWMIAMN